MWPEAPRIRWRREVLPPHRPELRELLTIPRAGGAAGGGTGGAGGQGQEVTAFSSYRRSDRSSTCGLPPADPVCGHVHENFLRNLLPALTIGDDGARTPWHTLRAAARSRMSSMWSWIASRMRRITSRRVFATATHPGRSGTYAPKLDRPFSNTTRYFIVHLL